MHEKPVNETKMSRLIGASSDFFSSSKSVKFSQYLSILFCLSSPPFIIANSLSQSKVSGQYFISGGNPIFPLTLALIIGWQNVGLKKDGIVTCPTDDESACVVGYFLRSGSTICLLSPIFALVRHGDHSYGYTRCVHASTVHLHISGNNVEQNSENCGLSHSG